MKLHCKSWFFSLTVLPDGLFLIQFIPCATLPRCTLNLSSNWHSRSSALPFIVQICTGSVCFVSYQAAPLPSPPPILCGNPPFLSKVHPSGHLMPSPGQPLSLRSYAPTPTTTETAPLSCSFCLNHPT